MLKSSQFVAVHLPGRNKNAGQECEQRLAGDFNWPDDSGVAAAEAE